MPGAGSSPALPRRCSGLRAVRALADAGIHCGVLMAPLVPGVTTRASLVEATLKAAADARRALGRRDGAASRRRDAHPLHARAGAEYPHLVAGYERLYAGKYAAPGYADEVQKMVGLLKARYGIGPRRRPAEVEPAEAPAAAPAATPQQMPMRFVRSRESRSAGHVGWTFRSAAAGQSCPLPLCPASDVTRGLHRTSPARQPPASPSDAAAAPPAAPCAARCERSRRARAPRERRRRSPPGRRGSARRARR